MIYRPRMAAVITVPVFGTTSEIDAQDRGTSVVRLPVHLRRATIEYNDHNTADTCELEAEWRDCGVDPRFLKHCTGEVWMRDIGDNMDLDLTRDSQFIGVCTKARRVAASHNGFVVYLELHDYTDFFLRNKLVAEGIPTFNDRLDQAWDKICLNTGYADISTNKIYSNVEILRGRLELRGLDVFPVLGEAVQPHFKRMGTLPVKYGATSWDVWKICCGMLGLITYIDRDKCIVTTTTEHYSVKKAPLMIWGENLLDADEVSHPKQWDKGVCVQSFDPIDGTVMEAYYPPPGDKRIRTKRAVARRKDYNPDEIRSDEYLYFEANYCHDQTQLDRIAQSAYDEASRQELEGKISTAEMAVDTADGNRMSLLDLRAGDAIQIRIDPQTNELLTTVGGIDARVSYLVDRGYTVGVAELIARNADALAVLKPVYHVKAARFSMENDKYECDINYHNLIDVSGHANENFSDVITIPEIDLSDVTPAITIPEVDLTQVGGPDTVGSPAGSATNVITIPEVDLSK